MKETADDELVRRVQNGDREAIGLLFARYWRAARASAFGVIGDWSAAEDAASRGFWNAITGIGSLQDPGRFAAWLRTIVIRAARTECRTTSRRDDGIGSELPDRGRNAEEGLLNAELSAITQQAARRLPEGLREAIALHYFEGYAAAEAARFLGIPDGTLRRRLHDGRELLRAAVENILNGRRVLDGAMQNKLDSLKAMIAAGAMEDAVREILAVRPAREELLDLLRNAPIDPTSEETLQRTVAAVLNRGLPHDPASPLAQTDAAIRAALSEFTEWQLDVSQAAARFFGCGEYADRLKAVLPPGFAQGRSGAYLRASRALVGFDAGAPTANAGIAEVLDLSWMVSGSLELRSVQQRTEDLIARVLPTTQARFRAHSEPRYRAAFQLELDGAHAAVGGVLNAWPGRPEGVDAAHVRIFLAGWNASPHHPVGS